METNNLIKFLDFMASIINYIHNVIIKLGITLGLSLTDKQLHFIVMALIGFILYLIINPLFKFLSKYNIAILSFIYTFTLLMVIVFGIEIEQKITRKGNMELDDIVWGLLGFLVFYAIYLIIVWASKAVKNYYNSVKNKNDVNKKC